MADKLAASLFKDWLDGEIVFAKDYKQETELLRVGINDNWARMIKEYRVLNPNGTTKATQSLDDVINTIEYKESTTIGIALDTDTSTLTFIVKDGSVTESTLADNIISTAKLKNGAISTVKLADLSVTESKIALNAVTNGKLADGSVTENKLATGSVSTSKIQDKAVTLEKLADGIFDPSTSAEMAVHKGLSPIDHPNGSVTDPKIGERTINDAQSPTQNNGLIGQLLSWLGNMIRQITGETSWRTSPAVTLKTLKQHVDSMNNPHNVNKSQIGLANVDNVQQATKSEFNTHVNNSVIHVTQSNKDAWNAAEQNAKNASVNKIAVYGAATPIDPNTTTDARILTNHENCPPGASHFYYIDTQFYNNTSSNRVQVAQGYDFANDVWVRRYHGVGWSAWTRMWNTENLPNPAQTNVANTFTNTQTFDGEVNLNDKIIVKGTGEWTDVESRINFKQGIDVSAGDIWLDGKSIIPARWNNGVYESWDGTQWKAVGGVKGVQRGSVNIPNDAGQVNIDVPISAVNLSKSTVSPKTAFMGTEDSEMATSVMAVTARLLDSTTIRFEVYTSWLHWSGNLYWEVVEYN